MTLRTISLDTNTPAAAIVSPWDGVETNSPFREELIQVCKQRKIVYQEKRLVFVTEKGLTLDKEGEE